MNLLTNPKLHLSRQGWRLATLVIGSSRRSTFHACKGISTSQITTSLGTSDASMALAKMSIKLMNKGIHQRANIVGMVMAQVLLKAALKKWGKEAEESVGKEMKQLH
jgi:hypothetical protein